MAVRVKLLAVSLRPSGHTHATFRGNDGRRVQWVFAPGQFTDDQVARARAILQTKPIGGK